MKLKSAGVILAVASVAAACSSPPEADDPPRQEDPEDSTPAPDATVGIDPELVDFYTQELNWSACEGGFECAMLAVPLDYSDPGGDSIDLAIVRLPADDPQGSLIVNPGGPGASGVDYARAATAVATDNVLNRFNLVGFDPRGVAQSTPIDCIDDAALDEYVNVDGTPDDAAEVTELQDQIEIYTSGCETNSGDMLPHLGTENVARDLDILRAALGDSELTYLGKSYGTFIGSVYADLFPARVGRMVLDGAVDPTLASDEYALGQAEGFERALDGFISWCVDEACSLGADEGAVRQAIIDLFEQADAEPLPTSDEDRPLTEALAFFGAIVPFYWPAGQSYPIVLEALERAINDNDGDGLLELADLYLERNSDGSYNSNSFEVFSAVSCIDHPESTTPEDVEAKIPRYETVSPVFGRVLAWGGLTCGAWPVESAVTPAPIAGEGANPILVVGTTGDPATPYAWAESLADQLSSGVLLTYDGTGHTAYRTGNSCIDQAVDLYLLSGTTPDEGTTC